MNRVYNIFAAVVNFDNAVEFQPPLPWTNYCHWDGRITAKNYREIGLITHEEYLSLLSLLGKDVDELNAKPLVINYATRLAFSYFRAELVTRMNKEQDHELRQISISRPPRRTLDMPSLWGRILRAGRQLLPRRARG